MTASVFSGARLIWLVNKASWSVVTAQVSLGFPFSSLFLFLSLILHPLLADIVLTRSLQKSAN